MAFEFLCATLIALLVGTAICFGGYRQTVLADSFSWLLFFLLLAVAGVAVQVMTTRRIDLEPYPARV